jgi:G protein-coupled receptor GPR1
MGSFCYLPVRPFWYRLSIVWIPRYLIFTVIIAIYASIYVYVGRKFAAFTALSHNSMDIGSATEGASPTMLPQNLDPRLPPLAYHGLIPHSPQDSLHELELPKTRRTEVHRSKSYGRRGSVHQFMILSSFTNRTEPSVPTIHSDVSIANLDLNAQQNPGYPTTQDNQDIPNAHTPNPFNSRKDSWRSDIFTHTDLEPVQELDKIDSRAEINNRIQQDAGAFQHETHEPSSHVESQSEQNNNLEILQTRDKIQKQLRYMFIYPLVYMGMWIIPFASHVFQYNDNYARNTPFILSCFTTVSICCKMIPMPKFQLLKMAK